MIFECVSTLKTKIEATRYVLGLREFQNTLHSSTSPETYLNGIQRCDVRNSLADSVMRESPQSIESTLVIAKHNKCTGMLLGPFYHSRIAESSTSGPVRITLNVRASP